MDGVNPDAEMFEPIEGSGRFSEMGQRVGNQLGQVAQGVGTAADGVHGIYSEKDNIMGRGPSDIGDVNVGGIKLKKFRKNDFYEYDNGFRIRKKGWMVLAVVIVLIIVIVVVVSVSKSEHLTVRFYEITGIKPRNLRRYRRRNE